MASLSEWLQLMLEEIARKREAEERGRAEEVRRTAERDAPPSPPLDSKLE
jgi:hypothetical protein